MPIDNARYRHAELHREWRLCFGARFMKTPSVLLFLLTIICLRAQSSVEPGKFTTTGNIETSTFFSTILGRPETIWIWLPPGYHDAQNAARKYPVIYLLDGDGMFDTHTAVPGREFHVDEALAQLIAAGRIEPLIAVAVGQNLVDKAGDGEGRYDEYIPYADPTSFAPDGREPRGRSYPDFLTAELLPYVSARYRVTADANKTAIAGVSYSGAAALYAIIKKPGVFGLALMESPSVQVGNGQLLRDTRHLWAAGKRIAIGIGTREDPADPVASKSFLRAVQDLAENLRGAYMAPKVQLTVEEGGEHHTKFFAGRIPNDLIFLFGKDQ